MRPQRLDDGAVHVAVANQLASTDRSEGAGVAQRIGQLEAGDDDLEATGFQIGLIVLKVERQLARQNLRVGQGVCQLIAMLTGVGDVGVADADARLTVSHVGD